MVKKQSLLWIILSFDVILGPKKEVNMKIFRDLCFVRFGDKINFENLKKEDSYYHEIFV